MSHPVVTISRQLGSGGAYVGQEVATMLGMRYVDREILAEAAQVLREDPTILEQREERLSGFLEEFFRAMAVGGPDSGYLPPPVPVIYDEQIFAVEARIIRKIALAESAVIVGRGGYHFLKGYAGLVNVFLHAPRGARLKRLAGVYGLTEGKADEMIRDSDTSRRRFLERVTGDSWSNALNFHLCIDTEEAGFPLTIDTIVSLVRKGVR